jgi:hypothetical protein
MKFLIAKPAPLKMKRNIFLKGKVAELTKPHVLMKYGEKL